MSATIAIRSAPAHQAVAQRRPQPLTAALAVAAAEAAAAAAKEGSNAHLRSVSAADRARVDLVREVMLERPAEAAVAREASALAEEAHKAFLQGVISLEIRNRHAARAAATREGIMVAAQGYLDRVKGGGYLAQSGIQELHRVA
jgi:hypothetical protein